MAPVSGWTTALATCMKLLQSRGDPGIGGFTTMSSILACICTMVGSGAGGCGGCIVA